MKKKMNIKLVFVMALLQLGISSLIPQNCLSAESLSMTIQVANDTSEPWLNRPVRHFLPPEINREDIINPAGMQIRFDEARSSLFLYDETDLQPDESKSYKIVVRDVWSINLDDLVFIENQIQSRLKYLEGTDDYDRAQLLADEFGRKIESIRSASQEIEGKGIAARIEAHRLFSQQIEDIRSKVTVMGDFVKEARWFESVKDVTGTIRFGIRAKNPLDQPQDDLTIKRYLPRGVHAEHVLEAKGFQIQFDPGRQLYFVTKDVSLGPKEEFKTTITIKNVWTLPETKMDWLVEKADELKNRLSDTQYEEAGKKIFDEISSLIDQVKDLQSKTETPLDIISTFSMNLKRFNAAQDGLDRLRAMVEEIEKPIPQTVPFEVKSATPDIATTWKIIFIVTGFMLVVGLLFFVLWWGQSKPKMNPNYKQFEKA